MRRQPGQIDQLFLDAGQTGLTVGARVLDNEGGTTISRTTGFVEFPAGSGLYYLDPFTFPDDRGTYTVVYDWDGGTAAPGFTASEDLEITSSTGEPFDGDLYATTTEFFRILKIRSPDAEQEAAAERVLTAATYQINAFIDREDGDPIAGAQIAVAENICLSYARDLWAMQEVRLGMIGIDGDVGPSYVARDVFARYTNDLWPLKTQFGFA